MITNLIGREFGWRMYFEPVINNPYLDDYYRDMKRWSFHLQVYFLSKRFGKTNHTGFRCVVNNRY